MQKRLILLSVLLAAALPLWAQRLTRLVSMDEKSLTVQQFLSQVEAQTGYSFAYDNADIDLQAALPVKADKEDVVALLNRLLASQGVRAQIDGTRIFLKTRVRSFAKGKSISRQSMNIMMRFPALRCRRSFTGWRAPWTGLWSRSGRTLRAHRN